MAGSLPPVPPSGPYLLPLAVGGELLRRNEEAESEDRFEFSRQPLRLEIFKLRLRLPEHWHIQAEAEHLSEPETQLPCSDRLGSEVKLNDSRELISVRGGKEMPVSLMTHAYERSRLQWDWLYKPGPST